MTVIERSTRQRSAIRAAVDAAGRPLLAQEVLELAQLEVPGLGLATVYRNLKSLTEAAELRIVQLPGENPRYEPMGEQSGHSHHHHFQCRACVEVFDVHACPGDLSKLAPPGFAVEDHEITLYGRCADCGSKAPRKRVPIKASR